MMGDKWVNRRDGVKKDNTMVVDKKDNAMDEDKNNTMDGDRRDNRKGLQCMETFVSVECQCASIRFYGMKQIV